MYSSLFPRDLLAGVERLQRGSLGFDTVSSSIRGFARGCAALNLGSTPGSVKFYTFAPGMDLATIDVTWSSGHGRSRFRALRVDL